MSSSSSSSASPKQAPVNHRLSKADQQQQQQGSGHKIVEGRASLAVSADEAVFYNKVQILNRDLSIQIIKLFGEKVQAERDALYASKLEKYNALLKQQQEQQPAAAAAASPVDQAAGAGKGKRQLNVKPPHPPAQGISVLDALAATGLRSVRYVKEIPSVRHITINDLDPAATAVIRRNLVSNGIDVSETVVEETSNTKKGVHVATGDGAMLMYNHKDALSQFDVIDLDPYGSATPFIDSAVQAVAHGGLLCVTCTDMSVFCGNYPEKCFALYGSMPLKAKYTHEQALRILLHCIDSAANKYKRHIVPWVSMSIDYYMRVFVRVYESPAAVKLSSTKRSMVFQSMQCASFYLQPLGELDERNPSAHPPHPATTSPPYALPAPSGNGASAALEAASAAVEGQKPPHFRHPTHPTAVPTTCPETGGRMRMGGPIWSAPIHDQGILEELLDRVETYQNSGDKSSKDSDSGAVINVAPRIAGLLTAMSEEIQHAPLFMYLPDLASALHIAMPPLIDIQSAIVNAGYAVSQFHHEPMALKTDAPPEVVWDVMRGYVKAHPQLREAQKHPQQEHNSGNKGKGKGAGGGKGRGKGTGGVGDAGSGGTEGKEGGDVAADVSGEAGRDNTKHGVHNTHKNHRADVAALILANPCTVTPDFTVPEALRGPKKRVARFPPNPESNWGPKRRATTNTFEPAAGATTMEQSSP